MDKTEHTSYRIEMVNNREIRLEGPMRRLIALVFLMLSCSLLAGTRPGMKISPNDSLAKCQEGLSESPPPPAKAPPLKDRPTKVDIGLFIQEITSIDEINGKFTAEVYLDLIWCDQRLRFDAETEGVDEKTFLEEDAAEKIESIWWPDIILENQAEPMQPENMVLTIQSDGTVDLTQRVNMVVSSRFVLDQFPFDHHTLEIEMESFRWPKKNIVFISSENRFQISKHDMLPEWGVIGTKSEVKVKKEIRDRDLFSEFVGEIFIHRRAGFYIFKIMMPLMLIVICSWSVFWMKTDDLADRMSVSLTVLLAVVAYQFIIVADLPKVPTITYMDAILLLSFVFMVAVVFENIIVNIIHCDKDNSKAEKIDDFCKKLFPVAYGTALLSTYMFYFK